MSARAFQWYLSMLRRHTLPTQMATGGVVGFTADILAQRVVENNGDRPHNWARTGRQAFYSSCIFAPVAYGAFAILNRIRLSTIWPTALLRTGTDMVTFMPSFTILYSGSMGMMEGRPFQEIKQRWQTNFPTIVKNQYMVFAPAQIINMAVLPLYARPPFMSIVGLGWTIYLATMNSRTVAPSAEQVQDWQEQLMAARTE